MQKAADILFEYTDFTSFSKLHTQVKTNNCKIMAARFFEENGLLVFEIKADRFLRNMVRAMVGSLLMVGFGKKEPEWIPQMLEEKNRNAAGGSVPGNALFLVGIEYDNNIKL
jgi:tRNA pseudouridine38-40 synthase